MGHTAFDFRRLETPSGNQRSEQLIRASAAAFSSLSRPAKLDIQQFGELTDALYERVSDEAKRHIAAVLASNTYAPVDIIRKLANEPVAIAAPVLAQSPMLTAGDLVTIIARHGNEHARVISNRADLDPSIRALLALMLRNHGDGDAMKETEASQPRLKASAGDVRQALRATMAANSEPAALPPIPAVSREVLVARLVPTALSGNGDFFRTALSDALDVPFAMTADIVSGEGTAGLSMALRCLLMPVAQAFQIAACLNPGRYLSTHSIAHFCTRYEAIALDAARDWLEDVKARSFDGQQAQATAGHVGPAHAANSDGVPQIIQKAG